MMDIAEADDVVPAVIGTSREANAAPVTNADSSNASTSNETAAAAVDAAVRRPSNRRLTRKPSLTKNMEERRKVRRDSRIRFREGDDLIDSCPARGPRKDIIPASCDRVLEVYRLACSKVKVRPLSAVIDFVQKIEDFSCRQECLNLKGVKLESRHCEALEEIFRRISVNVLNVDGCNLEDEGALAILEMVEFYEAAYIFVLSNNPRLSRTFWVTMSRAIKRSAFIHYVDLAHTAMDMNAIPLIARSLRANCPLTTLHLERNALSGPRTVILCASLKTNTNLAHLYLGDNGLIADDAIMLGAMLKGNRRLELLDVRDNHLLDQGVVLLCQALTCQEQGLNALVLWNNRFTAKSVPAMATMLALHRTLHTLEVGRNRLGNEGMDGLKLGLMRNRTVTRLGIMELGITTVGTIALAEYVGESPVLETVNLRRNNIKLGGLLALARAHKLSQTLVKLDLDTNIKCDHQDQEILKDLAASLEEYSFRNKQLAAERQIKESQELAIQEAEDHGHVASAENGVPGDADGVAAGTIVQEVEEQERDDDAADNDAVFLSHDQIVDGSGDNQPENLADEGLALKAHLDGDFDAEDEEMVFEEDEEATVAAGVPAAVTASADNHSAEVEQSRELLQSPTAEESLSFSNELEAALEELRDGDDAVVGLARPDSEQSSGEGTEQAKDGDEKEESVATSPADANHSALDVSEVPSLNGSANKEDKDKDMTPEAADVSETGSGDVLAAS